MPQNSVIIAYKASQNSFIIAYKAKRPVTLPVRVKHGTADIIVYSKNVQWVTRSKGDFQGHPVDRREYCKFTDAYKDRTSMSTCT